MSIFTNSFSLGSAQTSCKSAGRYEEKDKTMWKIEQT